MYQTDSLSYNIRICAAVTAVAGPFVWYEEPIVIEPENIVSQVIVLVCQEYRIGRHGKFPSRIHPYPYSPFGQTPLFGYPQLGTLKQPYSSPISRSRCIRNISSCIRNPSWSLRVLWGRIFRNIPKIFGNRKSSPHWNSCCWPPNLRSFGRAIRLVRRTRVRWKQLTCIQGC